MSHSVERFGYWSLSSIRRSSATMIVIISSTPSRKYTVSTLHNDWKVYFRIVTCIETSIVCLLEYQKTRERNHHRISSIEYMLSRVNETASAVNLQAPNLLELVPLRCHQPMPSPPVHNRTEKRRQTSRWMELMSRMKLGTWRWIPLMIAIIIIVVGLCIVLVAMKTSHRPVQSSGLIDSESRKTDS